MKLLEKKNIEQTYYDGAQLHNFITGDKSGRVHGLNMSFDNSNVYIEKGLLIVKGYRVIFDNEKIYTVHVNPIMPVIRKLIIRITATPDDSDIELITDEINNKDNIDKRPGIYDYLLVEINISSNGITSITSKINDLKISGGSGTTIIEKFSAGDGLIMEENVIALNPAYINYLEAQTYNMPTISDFEIITNPRKTVFEIGEKVRLMQIRHAETNLQNILGILWLWKKSGTTEIIPVKEIMTLDITDDEHTFTSTNGITYRLSGTSTNRKEFYVSKTLSAYYPVYYGLSNNATIMPADISVAKKKTSVLGQYNLTAADFMGSESKYFFICSNSAISSLSSGGFAVPYVDNSMSININGIDCNYHCYVTNKILSGEHIIIAG